MAGQAQPAPALQLTMYPCTESGTIQHGFNSALLPSTMGLHSANCPITGEPTLFSIHHPCNSQQLSLPRCVQGLPFAPAKYHSASLPQIGLPFAPAQPAAQPCFHAAKGLPSATKTCNTCCCQQYTINTHTVYIMYVHTLS